MTNPNIHPTTPDIQAETLLAEVKDLLALALTRSVSLHEVAAFLLKIENWEASK